MRSYAILVLSFFSLAIAACATTEPDPAKASSALGCGGACDPSDLLPCDGHGCVCPEEDSNCPDRVAWCCDPADVGCVAPTHCGAMQPQSEHRGHYCCPNYCDGTCIPSSLPVCSVGDRCDPNDPIYPPCGAGMYCDRDCTDIDGCLRGTCKTIPDGGCD